MFSHVSRVDAGCRLGLRSSAQKLLFLGPCGIDLSSLLNVAQDSAGVSREPGVVISF